MKSIQYILKLRKQNDDIKILITLIILILYVLYCIFQNGMKLHNMLSEPVEYIFLKNYQKLKQTDVENILELKNVKAVSPFIETSIELETFTCEGGVVTASYISDVYAVEIGIIKSDQNSKILFVSEKLWDIILDSDNNKDKNSTYKSNGNNKNEEQKNDNKNSVEMRYDIKIDGESFKRAKVVVIKSDKEEAFLVDNDKKLIENGQFLRVYVEKQDINMSTYKEICEKGYTCINENEADKFAGKERMIYLKIRYELIICGLCVLNCVIILYGKKINIHLI